MSPSLFKFVTRGETRLLTSYDCIHLTDFPVQPPNVTKLCNVISARHPATSPVREPIEEKKKNAKETERCKERLAKKVEDGSDGGTTMQRTYKYTKVIHHRRRGEAARAVSPFVGGLVSSGALLDEGGWQRWQGHPRGALEFGGQADFPCNSIARSTRYERQRANQFDCAIEIDARGKVARPDKSFLAVSKLDQREEIEK